MFYNGIKYILRFLRSSEKKNEIALTYRLIILKKWKKWSHKQNIIKIVGDLPLV